MSKPTKSSTSVLARVKLLHSYLWAGGWGGAALQTVAATRLPGDLFLKASSRSPLRKETGVRCLEPKIKCLPVCVGQQD